jgi:glycosyltransferase involved in cell wall biosynthesis
VAVVVAVLNEEAGIAACLDSLLQQNYPRERYDIIVVDNGSTDRTLDILSLYEGQLTLLHEHRRGAAAARNAGVAAAESEIIAFTDADCVVQRDWLFHLVQPLSDLGVGVVGGKILALQPATAIEQFGEFLHDHEASMSGRIPTAITMNWASRTADIRAAGGFDVEMIRGQDSDLGIRMFLRGHGFSYQPEAIVYHRNRRTFAGLFHEGYLHGVASVRLARKHARTYRQFGIRRIYPSSYLDLVRDFYAALAGRNRARAWCSVCFRVGKKVGKVVGSFRFGRFEL